MIARRHVFYVEGYDPRGAEGYYDIFRRSWKRCRGVWHFEGKLGELALDSDLIAHWDIEAAGPNWRVATRYEFLRLEGVIAGNMAEPMWRQVPRALAWMAGDLVTGTTARIFRAAWRFGLHLLYFQMLLWLWLGLALAGGALAGRSPSAARSRSPASGRCGRSRTGCRWCRSTAAGPICASSRAVMPPHSMRRSIATRRASWPPRARTKPTRSSWSGTARPASPPVR
jgi:hypothetical protein